MEVDFSASCLCYNELLCFYKGNFGLADYTKAVEINPVYVAAYVNRAAIKMDLGDKDGVIADMLVAAKLGNLGAQQWLKQNGISGW